MGRLTYGYGTDNVSPYRRTSQKTIYTSFLFQRDPGEDSFLPSPLFDVFINPKYTHGPDGENVLSFLCFCFFSSFPLRPNFNEIFSKGRSINILLFPDMKAPLRHRKYPPT